MDTIASLFSFITTPVSWVIVQFHSVYGKIFGPDTGWAWGLSIVSLVILIRICLIPLFVKQIKATRAMQTLQPEMKKIQERYKSDKQRQSEEMMKLYKESGTNPLSSCLPILAQSPFFFALYHVLNGIATGKEIGVIDGDLLESARKAHIFGAPLAAKFMDSADKVASLGASLTDVRVITALMIILMSASQFFTQRQLMTKNVDTTVKTPFMQQQKMLMYVFPIMFAIFGINFPVGVLVYWLTTNVWTMGQQMFVIRRNPTPGSKAQAAFLERLQKQVTHNKKVRGRGNTNVIKAIVAKGRDRNEFERKFINGLTKAGLAAQADGTVVESENTVVADGEEGTPAGAPKRQQPKRQSKAKRQSAVTQGAAKVDDEAEAKTSLEKAQDQPEDAAPKAKPAGSSTTGDKPGSGTRSKAKSGQQRKGQQRPKHPSSKK
ncbi:membrane protein insertase YidC [Streptomyces alfalfae]|uniref:Membrane protein insertase YidC n=1 Tax=Streptomyces alfalfae TaxID=1642299 RepID=A0ABN4VIK6_9ACTN|nr:membrane protein insertase YidC [Streptomyces alfalfae]APY87358.1 membrane protein insertase YidC [Streptomyces alfalfae]AYA17767.1 membrane protein insertase YidC [Streptomyces fradiae]RXX44978.1 membrane protein insertase YidC [Streptomyces alfalfae]RZN02884.1 membrane protein insertase YidC [Streptomyces alfalfae]